MSYALSRPSPFQRSSLLAVVIALHAGVFLLILAAKTSRAANHGNAADRRSAAAPGNPEGTGSEAAAGRPATATGTPEAGARSQGAGPGHRDHHQHGAGAGAATAIAAPPENKAAERGAGRRIGQPGTFRRQLPAQPGAPLPGAVQAHGRGRQGRPARFGQSPGHRRQCRDQDLVGQPAPRRVGPENRAQLEVRSRQTGRHAPSRAGCSSPSSSNWSSNHAGNPLSAFRPSCWPAATPFRTR